MYPTLDETKNNKAQRSPLNQVNKGTVQQKQSGQTLHQQPSNLKAWAMKLANLSNSVQLKKFEDLRREING